MLKVQQLSTSYGAVQAVQNVSFEVPAGQVVTLIGANGAGKSTIMNTLAGRLQPSGGQIWLNGRPLSGLRPDQIVKQGMALVPEGREIIAPLTVEENLALGAYARTDHAEITQDLAHAYTRFPRLKERRAQMAGSLSGGEQQMLAIARALMARPKLLMLDEPSMGLAPLLVNDVFQIIYDLHQTGVTILLVEQNAKKALQIASYGYILERGQIRTEGPADALRENPDIIAAYLGT